MIRAKHVIVEQDIALGLDELSRSLRCEADLLVTLVHEGVLEPAGDAPATWRFEAATVQRAGRAVRLARDLDLNPPGVALALQLLDEIRQLELQLGRRS